MADAVALSRQFDDAEQQRSAADLGIWIFLATEILFFGALVGVMIAMAARRAFSEFGGVLAAPAAPGNARVRCRAPGAMT